MSEEPDFENSCEPYSDACETHTLSALLGSSVFLPCNFTTSGLNWVSWAHTPGLDLVRLTPDGSIKFLDHRYGRVKAFPNQGSEGDFSIRIDELQNSDLGCYRCTQGRGCRQVELVAKEGEKEEPDFENSCEPYSDACEMQKVSALLGSSVFLPCNFTTSGLNWVSWARSPGLDLVRLTSDGSIKFLDHRYGRVKAFPNQGSEGDFSIRIDELQNSDLGCYRCTQGRGCRQVELVAKEGEKEEPDFENSCEPYSDACEMQKVSALLGSSVFLPCNFTTSGLNWVSWARSPGLDLVRLTSDGSIKFLDHRYGRVKAFPNQGSEGDFSIRIDELQNSDLGCYRCTQGRGCRQVELVAKEGEKGTQSGDITLLIFICVGVAAFILLSIGGYCCIKCILCCCNRTRDDTNNQEGTGTEGASAPPEETGRVPADQQQRGGGNNNLVYENDDQDSSSMQHDLTRNYCIPVGGLPDPDRTQPTQSTSGIYPNLNQFERTESQRIKQGFHRELFSRLRQASRSRHYYVNQGEINRQQAMSTQAENPPKAAEGLKKKKKKKAMENVEFKNPIYNRSTDQLNRP
ncbi:uncharacterized protein [Cebidichthys violaceus]|uniref:uncharacterized protein n=1 Tax=Cebidichthys violaceus TaxID=271503 RepID=UPI0035CA2B1F